MPESSSLSSELVSLLSPSSLSANARLYRLEAATGSSDSAASCWGKLQPEAWIAREALNDIGETRLLCLSLQADLPLDELIGHGVLLHTTCADGSLFTRSGLVRQAERLDAQGALARYRFTLVPWLWLATQQARSQIFQDRTLAEIVELTLEPYARQGATWRFTDDARARLQQQAPRRNYCTQWRETDYAFLSRLFTEEGLGWRVQPQPSATWGHEIVIFADSTQAGAVPDGQASPALYHRQGAQESSDAVQALARRTRLAVAAVSTAVWHPDARAMHEAQAGSHSLPPAAPRVQYDHLLGQDDGSKRLADSRSVERSAQRLIEGVEAHCDTVLGRSSLRALQSGTRLVIDQAPAVGLPEPATVVLDAIEQAGFNNLPTGSQQAIEARLGRAEDHLWFQHPPAAPDEQSVTAGVLPLLMPDAMPEDGSDDDGDGAEQDDRAAFFAPGLWQAPADDLPPGLRPDAAVLAAARAHGYANRFRAIHAQRPWRPSVPTGQASLPGPFLAPRPLACGVHSAIVVGPGGSPQPSGPDEIYTNARGDVRVRFHWQGDASASQGTPPPLPDNRCTRWVRVAQRQAGPGMGWQWLPRIGQEVLVKFTDGDPDQPVVIGAVFNGRGAGGVPATPGGAAASEGSSGASLFAQAHDTAPSAQHNLAAGLGGGHAPPWHGASPDAEGHRNAAALSGFKSKELGGPGFSQLVFDDSDRQLRVQLATTVQASQLNLGHLIHTQDNFRGGVRGQGLELRTDGYAAIRGGAGVLLTTYHGPGGKKLEPTGDFAAGMALLRQLATLSQSLDEAAATHLSVRLPGHAGSHKAQASRMDATQPPHAALLRSASTLVDAEATDKALAEAADKNPATGPGRVPHTGDAVIAAAARQGLLAVAGQHLQLSAGEDVTLAAGGAINLALNAQARLHAGQAIGLVAAAAGADHEGTGLSVIAAQEAIDMQAQGDILQIQAKEQLSLQSASAAIEVAAARKIRIATAQGAAIVIEGGNITFETPGSITYRSAMRTLQGPTQGGFALPQFPRSSCKSCILDAMRQGSPGTLV